MKQIEFSEDQLGDLQSIAEKLFTDSQDPRSYNYQRKLVRPNIRWGKLAIFCLLSFGGCFGLYAVLSVLGVSQTVATVISLAVLLVWLLLHVKRILICLVRIYQRYAPDHIRNKCRFEPSCSEYMILSLQKYGLMKGLRKGIDRLKRCNVNNGGYDEP